MSAPFHVYGFMFHVMFLSSTTSTLRQVLSQSPLFTSKNLTKHKPQVKEAVTNAITGSNNSVVFTGFVIDMFCTSMIDVAHEFGMPRYMFFTSGVALLNLMFYVHEQNIDTTKLKGVVARELGYFGVLFAHFSRPAKPRGGSSG
ncbi:hypothetical protein SLEP1_g42363 [Rubroshorea leprosula]|uniref:Uncharacterized protein n=1 Tax=Rubroshorea leprosula TaxID=152421 RepID=A0AAV5LAZ9_9ROSI|nr:hypothetical protein SLEP1_g42363 [Rubroshorea leprosula]